MGFYLLHLHLHGLFRGHDLELGRVTVTFRADIFNTFDTTDTIELYESREDDGCVDRADYGQPTAYQTPRSVRFGICAKF